MQYFIDTVVATADHVGNKLKKQEAHQDLLRRVEHLVPRRAPGVARRSTTSGAYAPRQLEDVYSVADAVVLGNLLITLLKNHDRVTSASLAQLVNVIAPIMTEPGGAAWRQTTFFPFSVTSRLARGEVLRPPRLDRHVRHRGARRGRLVDAVATFDEADGSAAVFLVNRAPTETADRHASTCATSASTGCARRVSLWDDDVYAKNTMEDQNRVGLRPTPVAAARGRRADAELPPVSWTGVVARLTASPLGLTGVGKGGVSEGHAGGRREREEDETGPGRRSVLRFGGARRASAGADGRRGCRRRLPPPGG